MKTDVKRLLRELSPYKGWLVLSIICAAVSVILTLAGPVLSGNAVDCLLGPGQVDYSELFSILRLMVMALIGVAISTYLMNLVNNRVAYRLNRRLRNEAFDHLLKVKISLIDSHPSGDYQSRIIADADAVCDGLLLGFSQLFTGVITIIGTISFMFFVSFKLCFIVVALTPLSMFVAKFITSRTYRFFKDQAADRGELTDFADERISAQKLLHAAGAIENTKQEFEEYNEKLTKSSLLATFYSSLPNPSSRAVNNLIYTAVGVIGAIFTLGGGMTVGGLVAFLAYAREYAKPFNDITGVLSEMQNAFACAGRLFELMDAETEIAEPVPVISSEKGDSQEESDHAAIADKIANAAVTERAANTAVTEEFANAVSTEEFANVAVTERTADAAITDNIANAAIVGGTGGPAEVGSFKQYQSPENGKSTLVGNAIAKGEISIQGVDFSYRKGVPFMKDLNLRVAPGQRVAIVGPTGSGKTTFVNLLMRFYDVDKGRITIDGKEIREIPLKTLRHSFGMVLQETWLFSGTIAENLAMGDPNISRDDMERAAKRSRAHEFIRRLERGYDTELSTDGGSLSQGQKQLLCITRVMLHLPEMLILDEATSSIDTRTEQKIQAALAEIMYSRTTFIVAHRLQTIRNSDIICFMEHGSVIEQGTHEDLMARGGAYASLYEAMSI